MDVGRHLARDGAYDLLQELRRDDDADLPRILFQYLTLDGEAVNVRRGEGDLSALHLHLAAREDGAAVTLFLAQTGECGFFDQTCKRTVFDGKLQCPFHTLKNREVICIHGAQGKSCRTGLDDGEAVTAFRVDGDFLGGEFAGKFGEIFPGEYRCTDAVDLGGDGDDEAQLIVCGLEFELTVLRRQVDTGEDGGLRFGGESLADGLQGGDEVISPECDVHMVSFPMDGRAFVRAVFSFSMGTV